MLKEENKKTVLFVVPDGTGIRNYLFSDILPYLNEKKHHIYIYHALDEKAINEVKSKHQFNFDSLNFVPKKETLKQKFFRESISFARLKYNSKLVENSTILSNWNPKKNGLKKYFYKFVEFFGDYLSNNYNRILRVEGWYDKSLKKDLQIELNLLKKINPISVFCTHQRAINAIPIIKAAKLLKIKTIGAIYSWDNMPKARLTVRTDKYIVWSEYMKKEFELYYPEIKRENIIVTGTPQFDFYKNDSIGSSRNNFFKQHNLDLNKKTICFSGDDILTSPHDPVYLEDLAEKIEEHKLEIQIIFRRSPVDLSKRYDNVLNKHKNIITPITPIWSNKGENWTTLFPYFEDVKLLYNICKYSDLVINVGSTMAHDFAHFNNPAAYLNYNVKNDLKWSVEKIYKFQHFKSMPNKDQVYWINSKEEIIKIIESALKTKSSAGKDWYQLINTNKENISLSIFKEIIS